ncbi:hypothetical protein [Amycolatopsis saalfeldensis]|uniref:Uncharacterized protein n=1 Tax=Amycolatopsis saalfeldensis TaxID=394193 RepID=A0A1H8YMC5_9PSEU|nr:hypothetical protein [Amycolatopsis saalfeldensis]SEP53340.1 hypothetical protein SAMN04489732_12664 [Amycolatopsis saalfeldensis]
MAAKKNSQRKPTPRAAQKAVAQARAGSRRNGLLWGGAAVIVVALLVAVIVAVTNSAGTKQADTAATNLNNPPATTAVGRNAPPPWPAPADAAAAVRTAGLPMLTAEGNVEHIHAHLDVRVDGQPVEVPPYLGIDQTRGSISPLHTHDTTGVIHIESPVKREFTLGELFSEWDVSLSADNIGALHATDGKTLRVYVNGTLRGGNPAAITFNAHDEIVLIYGAPQPGESVPSRYDFPAGD